MSGISRRRLLTAGATAGALGALSACSAGGLSVGGDGSGGGGSTAQARPVKPIGDGSTADTGAQPHQPKAARMKAGTRPPQFVVFSWDGAGEVSNKLFSRFREVAADHDASMTFFLSGIYTLPESKKHLYHPPRHAVGASAIGYLADRHIHATLQQLRSAWLEGHEIGTHFNGHFCGADGVRNWSGAEWRSEIEQAVRFVTEWKTNTGFTHLDPLPFDYRKELIGGRTPCLEGQANLLPTAAAWAVVREAVMAVPAAAVAVTTCASSLEHGRAEAERLGPVVGFPAAVLMLARRFERQVVAAAEGADPLVPARDGDRARLGPRSLGPAVRFAVDHAPCPVPLVWPESAPDLTAMPPPPPSRHR
ncbi:hypothetical protein [Streptomyces sp. NPDC051636]|uniref:hypothetical protein n=1 Tax=Streptomyces sp. NPDC051636 TaxID=3365663 RepID=UPI00379604E2